MKQYRKHVRHQSHLRSTSSSSDQLTARSTLKPEFMSSGLDEAEFGFGGHDDPGWMELVDEASAGVQFREEAGGDWSEPHSDEIALEDLSGPAAMFWAEDQEQTEASTATDQGVVFTPTEDGRDGQEVEAGIWGPGEAPPSLGNGDKEAVSPEAEALALEQETAGPHASPGTQQAVSAGDPTAAQMTSTSTTSSTGTAPEAAQQETKNEEKQGEEEASQGEEEQSGEEAAVFVMAEDGAIAEVVGSDALAHGLEEGAEQDPMAQSEMAAATLQSGAEDSASEAETAEIELEEAPGEEALGSEGEVAASEEGVADAEQQAAPGESAESGQSDGEAGAMASLDGGKEAEAATGGSATTTLSGGGEASLDSGGIGGEGLSGQVSSRLVELGPPDAAEREAFHHVMSAASETEGQSDALGLSFEEATTAATTELEAEQDALVESGVAEIQSEMPDFSYEPSPALEEMRLIEEEQTVAIASLTELTTVQEEGIETSATVGETSLLAHDTAPSEPVRQEAETDLESTEATFGTEMDVEASSFDVGMEGVDQAETERTVLTEAEVANTETVAEQRDAELTEVHETNDAALREETAAANQTVMDTVSASVEGTRVEVEVHEAEQEELAQGHESELVATGDTHEQASTEQVGVDTGVIVETSDAAISEVHAQASANMASVNKQVPGQGNPLKGEGGGEVVEAPSGPGPAPVAQAPAPKTTPTEDKQSSEQASEKASEQRTAPETGQSTGVEEEATGEDGEVARIAEEARAEGEAQDAGEQGEVEDQGKEGEEGVEGTSESEEEEAATEQEAEAEQSEGEGEQAEVEVAEEAGAEESVQEEASVEGESEEEAASPAMEEEEQVVEEEGSEAEVEAGNTEQSEEGLVEEAGPAEEAAGQEVAGESPGEEEVGEVTSAGLTDELVEEEAGPAEAQAGEVLRSGDGQGASGNAVAMLWSENEATVATAGEETASSGLTLLSQGSQEATATITDVATSHTETVQTSLEEEQVGLQETTAAEVAGLQDASAGAVAMSAENLEFLQLMLANQETIAAMLLQGTLQGQTETTEANTQADQQAVAEEADQAKDRAKSSGSRAQGAAKSAGQDQSEAVRQRTAELRTQVETTSGEKLTALTEHHGTAVENFNLTVQEQQAAALETYTTQTKTVGDEYIAQEEALTQKRGQRVLSLTLMSQMQKARISLKTQTDKAALTEQVTNDIDRVTEESNKAHDNILDNGESAAQRTRDHADSKAEEAIRTGEKSAENAKKRGNDKASRVDSSKPGASGKKAKYRAEGRRKARAIMSRARARARNIRSEGSRKANAILRESHSAAEQLLLHRDAKINQLSMTYATAMVMYDMQMALAMQEVDTALANAIQVLDLLFGTFIIELMAKRDEMLNTIQVAYDDASRTILITQAQALQAMQQTFEAAKLEVETLRDSTLQQLDSGELGNLAQIESLVSSTISSIQSKVGTAITSISNSKSTAEETINTVCAARIQEMEDTGEGAESSLSEITETASTELDNLAVSLSTSLVEAGDRGVAMMETYATEVSTGLTNTADLAVMVAVATEKGVAESIAQTEQDAIDNIDSEYTDMLFDLAEVHVMDEETLKEIDAVLNPLDERKLIQRKEEIEAALFGVNNVGRSIDALKDLTPEEVEWLHESFAADGKAPDALDNLLRSQLNSTFEEEALLYASGADAMEVAEWNLENRGHDAGAMAEAMANLSAEEIAELGIDPNAMSGNVHEMEAVQALIDGDTATADVARMANAFVNGASAEDVMQILRSTDDIEKLKAASEDYLDGQSLDEFLEYNLPPGSDLNEARAMLENDDIERRVDSLYNSMNDVTGTDTRNLFRNLEDPTRSIGIPYAERQAEQEWSLVRARYEAKYGRSLQGDIAGETQWPFGRNRHEYDVAMDLYNTGQVDPGKQVMWATDSFTQDPLEMEYVLANNDPEQIDQYLQKNYETTLADQIGRLPTDVQARMNRLVMPLENAEDAFDQAQMLHDQQRGDGVWNWASKHLMDAGEMLGITSGAGGRMDRTMQQLDEMKANGELEGDAHFARAMELLFSMEAQEVSYTADKDTAADIATTAVGVAGGVLTGGTSTLAMAALMAGGAGLATAGTNLALQGNDYGSSEFTRDMAMASLDVLLTGGANVFDGAALKMTGVLGLGDEATDLARAGLSHGMEGAMGTTGSLLLNEDFMRDGEGGSW